MKLCTLCFQIFQLFIFPFIILKRVFFYAFSKPSTDYYLSGNFAPVKDEITNSPVKVSKGEIPKDLKGSYFRNGPNNQFPPRGFYHWFDGDGMVHAVKIQDGKAFYSNKYVETNKFKAEKKIGKSIGFGLKHILDPFTMIYGYFEKYYYYKISEDINWTSNTALVYHNNHLFALVENQLPFEIDKDTLKSVGLYNFGGKYLGSFTAHPKVDPRTKELIFFGYGFGERNPKIHYGIASSNGFLTKKTTIHMNYDSMMHDFAITESYTIFLDLPFLLNVKNALSGKPTVEFDNNLPSRFGIMKRYDDSKVQWFELPTCYIFHVANAWEEEDTVVLHAVKHTKIDDDFFSFKVTNHNIFHDAYLCEWRFDLKTGKSTEKVLCKDISCEFPTINPNYVGVKNQYVYIAEKVESKFSALVKIDLTKGAVSRFDYGKNTFGGEGVFVPKNNSKSEDDGYLVTFAHNQDDSKSYLYIIDGLSMNLTCKLEMPRRVPAGFHGIWVDE